MAYGLDNTTSLFMDSSFMNDVFWDMLNQFVVVLIYSAPYTEHVTHITLSPARVPQIGDLIFQLLYWSQHGQDGGG